VFVILMVFITKYIRVYTNIQTNNISLYVNRFLNSNPLFFNENKI